MAQKPNRAYSMDETTALLKELNQKRGRGSSTNLSGLGNVPASPKKVRRPSLFHSSSSTSIHSVQSDGSMGYDSLSVTKHKFGPSHSNKRHKQTRNWAYWTYYLPVLSWLPKYSVRNDFSGDLAAGLSVAAYQVPLVISIARLAGLGVKSGLFCIIVGPYVYAMFGSSKFLMVGPGAAIALILGNMCNSLLADQQLQLSRIEVASCATYTMGLIMLVGGLLRLGFVGNIVSMGFINGSLGGVGLLIIVTELVVQFGLSELFAQQHFQDPDTWTVLKFVIVNARDHCHALTLQISIVCFLVLYTSRKIKAHLLAKDAERFKWLNFFPEILFVVAFAMIFSALYGWGDRGVSMIGKPAVEQPEAATAVTKPTFAYLTNLRLIHKCLSAAAICVLMGFVDSNTACKVLENVYNVQYSTNRELIALGFCNVIGSLFGMLPAFGGYGRSKVCAMNGKTPMSGVVFATAALVFYTFCQGLLRYLPECVSATVITSVCVGLVEEVPPALKFYYRIKGYDEIGVCLATIIATLVWSTEAGLTIGVALSVMKILRYATSTKIQILGRVPNSGIFRNADELIEETFESLHHGGEACDDLECNKSELASQLEYIENCLVIKITEPLFFANASQLKIRLRRIERYGSLNVHPSQPVSNKPKVKYIIFDCKNMASIDSSAAMTLYDIVCDYCARNFVILFARVPFDAELRARIVNSGISSKIKEALQSQGGFIVNQASQLSEEDAITDDLADDQEVAIGLGDGFYTSIDSALKVVSDCEVGRERLDNALRSF